MEHKPKFVEYSSTSVHYWTNHPTTSQENDVNQGRKQVYNALSIKVYDQKTILDNNRFFLFRLNSHLDIISQIHPARLPAMAHITRPRFLLRLILELW